MKNLGEEELVAGFTCLGAPDGPDLLDIMLEAISAIDMTPDGPPDVREYPNGHGKGGHGWQLYQPLTESWIIGGTWPRLKQPCTRVVLSSCKPYDKAVVANLLSRRIGPILKSGGFPL